MLDLDTLLLEPVYATWGRDATVTPPEGAPFATRVLDRTQGEVLDEAGPGPGAVAVVPVLVIRRADLPGSPTGAVIALSDGIWRVVSAVPRLNGQGVATGEWRLVVEPHEPDPDPEPEP